MTTHEWPPLDPGPVQEWPASTVAAGHGECIRRRRTLARMLDRLDRLVSVPALWRLRTLRTAVWIVAVICWLMSRRMDSLLLFVVAVALQLMIMQVVLVHLLREEGER